MNKANMTKKTDFWQGAPLEDGPFEGTPSEEERLPGDQVHGKEAALRTAYQSMRYQGAMPAWQPQVSRIQPGRVSFLVPALAFAVLCSFGIWWWSPFGVPGSTDGREESLMVVAEARFESESTVEDVALKVPEPVVLEATRPEITFSRTSLPKKEVPLELVSREASGNLEDSGQLMNGFADDANLTVRTRIGRAPRLELAELVMPIQIDANQLIVKDKGKTAELANVEEPPNSTPQEEPGVFESFQQLRDEVQVLRQAGVTLPTAQPSMRFRLPKSPAANLRPRRPSPSSASWAVDGGAAGD